MNRPPPQPPREGIAADELGAYEHVVARSRKLEMPGAGDRITDPYWGALLNTPPLARGLAEMGRLIREGELRGSYSNAQRELVDIVLSVDLKYNAILAVHIPDALAVGVRIEAIDAIRTGRDDRLTAEELTIARYARAVAEGRSDDDLFQAMVGKLGLRGAIEFTVFIAFLVATLRLWQALGVSDPSNEDIDRMLDDLRSGRKPLPDPNRRIG